jgi:hypothetical protein
MGVQWTDLAEDRHKQRVPVNTEMNLRRTGNFLSSLAITGY